MPEFKKYFGVDLKVVKALYGEITANQCWDDELSWLLEKGLEYERCLAETSMFIKRQDGCKLVLINDVDEQLHYSTSETMRKWFEACLDGQ